MPLPVTPSQTVGPFYGYALPIPDGAHLVPPGTPGAITVHGRVFDGAGAPIPDALLEIWQPAPDATRTGLPGSMRRDPVTGGYLGRNGVDFTGFGRVTTDADGHYAWRTLPPGGVPYLSVIVFARGLLHHLHTRVYLPGAADDALLASLEPARRATLLAVPEREGVYGFDIRLQGNDEHEETVFLVFD
ncbi:protocatechuate 3,4-dioxygenase subunit alpha [Streptomyces sp. NPDC102274]|uniref:protocatechuate 3,4-dioxygenase subunit alpha n=1 Tax=Streptomyces sp. NPDC102274 TaxID=3366151 RepID=UPI0037F7048D